MGQTADQLPVTGILHSDNDAFIYVTRDAAANEDRFTPVSAEGIRGEVQAIIKFNIDDGNVLSCDYSHADDSLYFYENYCYRQNIDDTFTRMAMPTRGHKYINSNGLVTQVITSRTTKKIKVFTLRMK